MTGLLKDNWKYILAGFATPVLILFFRDRLKAQIPAAIGSNPYANLKAFLTMIQYAEGTFGSNAYRMLYGGQLFSGFSDHPNMAITKSGITSTAAGAYQILYRTWISVQPSLDLVDFSPVNQDKAAIELIRRRGAIEDVLVGRFETAVSKCRKEWASLPGAGYRQRERSMAYLVQVYQNAGGQITA